MTSGPGLLLAISDEPAGREAEFNRWYDQHASARLTIPGISGARRYRALDGRPRYLADYELDTVGVMESARYLALRSNRPPGEQEMLDSLPNAIDRRIYKQLGNGPSMSVTDNTATHTVVLWSHEMWSRSHSEIRGSLHCRSFQLLQGNGAEFLSLHDVNSLGAAERLAEELSAEGPVPRIFAITHRYRPNGTG